MAEAKSGCFSWGAFQGEPVRMRGEIRFGHPGMHGVATDDQTESALFQLWNHAFAALVPGCRFTVGVRALAHPIHPVLGDPVANGDGLCNGEHRKVEHHPVLEGGARVHAQKGELDSGMFWNELVARHTPAAAESFENIVSPEKDGPRSRAFNPEIAGVDGQAIAILWI